jgi:hypothetical protein
MAPRRRRYKDDWPDELGGQGTAMPHLGESILGIRIAPDSPVKCHVI